MEKKIRIITHSGNFHADEILAVAALQILIKDAPHEVIRTRDADVIRAADYVVDVGGIYDAATNRFDHHQQGGAGTRENGIPYSAFGLVWKHYGEAICGSKQVAHAIDEQIGYPVDMGDNGHDYYKLIRQDTEPLIIQFVVAMFRPTWTEGLLHDERFFELLTMMRRILLRTIKVETDKEDGARFVEEAYAHADDKRIVILDHVYPWHDVLAGHSEPLYIVKPKSVGTNWEVECVRDNPYGFKNRKDLPLKWAGHLEGDEKLAQITGVQDVVFCHNMRYVAVTKSKEGAVKLAQIAADA